MLSFFRQTFRSAFGQFLVLLLAVVVCLFVKDAISLLFSSSLGGASQEADMLGGGVDIPWLRVQMGLNTLFIFVLPALLAAWLVGRYPWVRLGLERAPVWGSVLNAMLLALASQPFISYAAQANALLPLPEWAAKLEQVAEQLTQQVLYTDSWEVLLVNLLVVALLPALGEELFFRGFVQNLLYRVTRNAHAGILLAALLFSLFHFQFAGFVPRFLLGAVLGYLYYSTHSIWVPIAAHFANNAIVVVVYYGVAKAGVSIDQVEAAGADNTIGMGMALLSLGVSILIMRNINTLEQLWKRRRNLARRSRRSE